MSKPRSSADLAPFGGDANVRSSVLYAAGHVIGESGIAGYGSRLGKGDTDGALFGPGLLNPETADIHLVIRTHGPAEGGMTNDEIHSEYATRLAPILSSQFSSRSLRSPRFSGQQLGAASAPSCGF